MVRICLLVLFWVLTPDVKADEVSGASLLSGSESVSERPKTESQEAIQSLETFTSSIWSISELPEETEEPEPILDSSGTKIQEYADNTASEEDSVTASVDASVWKPSQETKLRPEESDETSWVEESRMNWELGSLDRNQPAKEVEAPKKKTRIEIYASTDDPDSKLGAITASDVPGEFILKHSASGVESRLVDNGNGDFEVFNGSEPGGTVKRVSEGVYDYYSPTGIFERRIYSPGMP